LIGTSFRTTDVIATPGGGGASFCFSDEQAKVNPKLDINVAISARRKLRSKNTHLSSRPQDYPQICNDFRNVGSMNQSALAERPGLEAFQLPSLHLVDVRFL
jgi:hypothetical protein